MESLESALRSEERTSLRLRSLYGRHGYRQYKVSKFEEYDLYARNKRFLVSDSVLTFTDTDGRLMALKPDVTLSIIKNAKDGEPGLQKLCYHETVYRPGGSGTFREIPQDGLECLGDLDFYTVCEVLMLAVRSLEAISDRCVLNLTHLGLLETVLDGLAADEATRAAILRCMARKSRHELETVCAGGGMEDEGIRRLLELTELHGQFAAVLPRLQAFPGVEAYVAELESMAALLADWGVADRVVLDFSLTGDLDYYSGVVFQGYVDGVPARVLSGGRYDKLMERLGKHSGAIGFAVYLDQLERLGNAPLRDVDALLLYDEDEDPKQVLQAVKLLGANGKTVRAQRGRGDATACGQVLQLKNGRLEILATDD